MCHRVLSVFHVASKMSRVTHTPANHHDQVIAVDEAQFFPDLLDFCKQAADRDAKVVLVAGLDGDFRRRQFGQVGCALGAVGQLATFVATLQLWVLLDPMHRDSSRQLAVTTRTKRLVS